MPKELRIDCAGGDGVDLTPDPGEPAVRLRPGHLQEAAFVAVVDVADTTVFLVRASVTIEAEAFNLVRA